MGIRRKSEPISWSEQTMREYLQHFRSNPRYKLHNLYVFGWESDLLFLSKSGVWTEIEIKVSRSDFLADLKKVEKHSVLADKQNHMKPNRFFYAVPEGLVLQDEVPDYAGLLWVMNSGCHFTVAIKPAPSLHNHKITPEDLKLADKFYFNMVSAKTDALVVRNQMRQIMQPYHDGVAVGRRQAFNAALKTIADMCPYRTVVKEGKIHCGELDQTHFDLCSRGLCNYLAEIEEKIQANINQHG